MTNLNAFRDKISSNWFYLLSHYGGIEFKIAIGLPLVLIWYGKGIDLHISNYKSENPSIWSYSDLGCLSTPKRKKQKKIDHPCWDRGGRAKSEQPTYPTHVFSATDLTRRFKALLINPLWPSLIERKIPERNQSILQMFLTLIQVS